MKTKKNTFTIEGNIVIVDIRTKKFPEAEMLVDLNDWEILNGLQDAGRLGRICCSQQKNRNTAYAVALLDRKLVQIHRLLLPDSIMVDHISRDGIDNRRSNIRESNAVLNQRNRKKNSDNTSGVTGVSWHKKHQKWTVNIGINKKQTCLGYFDNLNDATSVRKAAESAHGYTNG